MMNESMQQDVTSADASEMLINERMNKTVKIFESMGWYEIPAVDTSLETAELKKED